MVVIKLSGGIGNQLFQYAFGRSISLKYDINVEFDIFFYNSNFNNVTKRELQLQKFNTQLTYFNSNKFIKYIYLNNNIPSKIKRIIYHPNYKYINESNFSDSLFHCKRIYYFDGYWQSEIFFNSYSKILRDELTFNLDYTTDELRLINSIKSNNSISLHIRRGDYITNKKAFLHHGICSLEYYENAIQFFKNKFSNCKFYIFSDDINWAKMNLSIANDAIFINLNLNFKDLKELRLMSYCSNHIISNSSYSWWGAWLNPSTSKIVIRPSPWFTLNKKIDSVICPPNWLKFNI